MKTLILATLFLLSSCGSMITPKADSKKVKQIEKLAKTIAFKRVKRVRASRKMLTPLKRGQWVASLTTDKKSGDKNILIRKIVRVTKHSVTIETETYSSSKENPLSPTAVQQVLANYPKTFAVNGKMNFTQLLAKLKITSMKIKDGDKKIQDMSHMSSSPFSQIGIKGISQGIKLGKSVKKKCHSPYLKSARCYAVPYTAGVLGFNVTGSYLQNSYVPIIGYLQTESEYQIEEVIAYGFKGRKIIIH